MSKDKSNFSGNKQQIHPNQQQPQEKQQVRPEQHKPSLGGQQGWQKPGMGTPSQGSTIGKGQFPGQKDQNKK